MVSGDPIRVLEGLDIQSEFEHGLIEQLEQLRQRSPGLYDCIDCTRISSSAWPPSLAEEILHVVDFEDRSRGGRGESYRHAQQNPMVRAVGIRQLFNLVSPGHDLRNLSPKHKILDVLGGDGVLTRALFNLIPSPLMPSILTSDLSEDMIAAAQAYDLAAIRQPAQFLFLKDNCFDAVLIAYGTHHIPQDRRLQVCQEAFRVLKPGGQIVLHDFEEDSPVACWFSEVVDQYSLTGHNFSHFTLEEISHYLLEAGFADIDIQYLYDPFILSGDSPRQLKRLLGEHLLNMYSLVKLMDKHGDQHAWSSAYALALKYFRYDYQRMELNGFPKVFHIQIFGREGHWYIEMPRVALVGSAKKPPNVNTASYENGILARDAKRPPAWESTRRCNPRLPGIALSAVPDDPCPTGQSSRLPDPYRSQHQ